MKLHFEDDLDYQKAAIESVVNLFKGQEISRSEFTVLAPKNMTMDIFGDALGIGNRLLLVDEELKENLRKVQLTNGLRPTEKLVSGDFTVEMETGTGKTYVYLRTIFELNKNYGFTKFIIVVPSVAIKSLVQKEMSLKEFFISNIK